MKVLLTGANGFVGSHLLDRLLTAGHEVTALLRPSANPRFIAGQLNRIRVIRGPLTDPAAMAEAVAEAEAVIHCAGSTRALRPADFYSANRDGTRTVVAAVNGQRQTVRHLVHLSSLAVSGPGTPDRPARESDSPRPVSAYGRSKARAEEEVTQHCATAWTILRLGPVYGPRDEGFLPLFRLVQRRVLPLVNRGRLALSLVYVEDVTAAVLTALGNARAAGRIYHVGPLEPCSLTAFAEAVARALQVGTVRMPVPGGLVRAAACCAWALGRLRGQATMLNPWKVPELLAEGWVAACERIRDELGFVAETPLATGVARTIAWYRAQGWL